MAKCSVCHINDRPISYVTNNKAVYKKICSSCNYIKNRDDILSKSKEAYKKNMLDPDKRIKHLMKQAIIRNKEWTLTYEQCISFWNKNCSYCGDAVDGLHLDRINPDHGYIINNVVSSCANCNMMKYTFSKEEFLNFCKKITKYQEVNFG